MKRLKLQAGAELVEFAFVLPLLLLMVFGVVDFSLAIFDKAVITNAAREGARAGMVMSDPRPTESDIQTVVANYCSTHLIGSGGPGPTTTATPSNGWPPSSGDTLSVSVEYSYNYIVLSKLIPSLGSLGLTSTSVMRYE